MKKVLNIIADILAVILLIWSVAVLLIVITSNSNGGMPNLFGKTILTVQSDSMEPTFYKGDLIAGSITDDKAEFNVGDIVTFRAYQDNIEFFNTHRIIEKNEIGGIIYYHTKGDNTESEDFDPVTNQEIVAKVSENFRIPKAGKALDFLKTPNGVLFCLVLPVAAFFLFFLFKFINNLIKYNRAKSAEAAADAAKKAAEEAAASGELTEEQKKKAIEEYLAEQSKLKDEADGAVNAGREPEDEPKSAEGPEAEEKAESDGESDGESSGESDEEPDGGPDAGEDGPAKQ